MSKLIDKIKRSKRFYQKSFTLKNKVNFLKSLSRFWQVDEPHKFAEKPIMRCSHSYCTLCGNPRKMYKQVTVKEKVFEDIEKYELACLCEK